MTSRKDVKTERNENESISGRRQTERESRKSEVFSPSREITAGIGAVELSVAWFQAAGRE
ncbi:hypothetical protein IFM47457_07919 [Aspergillus lentulus]|nr:hypothetical protein IFM47457_07919 [Aspergillus lentulus]